MKRNKKLIFALFVCLAFVVHLTSCTDERTRPTQPVDPTYIETKILIDRVSSSGDEVTVNFTVRDVMTGGNLIIYTFLQSDDDMVQMTEIESEIGGFQSEIDSISALIFDLWLTGELNEADSLAMEQAKADLNESIQERKVAQDILDTWLDDRFKLSIRLDDDSDPIYPLSVMLDQNTTLEDGTPLGYLGDSTIVWGQGNYLVEADSAGWYGRRITLDLTDFWVADQSWVHPEKPSRAEFLIEPARYPDRYTRFELLPVRNWLDRMTPNETHTLHVKFGSSATVTEVSAILYAIYSTAE